MGEVEVAARALSFEQEKVERRAELQVLHAPERGYVKQLSVHTVGGVVTVGQALMEVVPLGAELKVEAYIENKDIGVINADQEVEMKVDAFPFTEYGTVRGRIAWIAADSSLHEQLGLVYKVVAFASPEALSDHIRLAPGMTVTVDIKTGKRRLIELFLSPLLRFKEESLRER